MLLIHLREKKGNKKRKNTKLKKKQKKYRKNKRKLKKHKEKLTKLSEKLQLNKNKVLKELLQLLQKHSEIPLPKINEWTTIELKLNPKFPQRLVLMMLIILPPEVLYNLELKLQEILQLLKAKES